MRETPLGRKTIRVLLIHGMIFIHTDKATSFSLINDHGLNIVYLKDIEGRHSLIVPDKQMHDFMFLLDFFPERGRGVKQKSETGRPGTSD